MSCRLLKFGSVKKIMAAIVFTVAVPLCFSENWILASQKFTFTQKTAVSSSQDGMASLLPQLILEQISSNIIRVPSNDELIGRKSEELLLQRQSLFLQLSKEVQVRDSLVVQYTDAKKRQKMLEEQEAKIEQLKQSIDKNIQEQQMLYTNKENVFSQLQDVPVPSETVVLYKTDPSKLFAANNDDSDISGVMDFGSREFENAVNKEKINGLLTGRITAYGEYLMVTVELYSFPGGTLLGTVTDVGNSSRLQELAVSLVQMLMPKIANTLPVQLCIELTPQEVCSTARMTLDGVVYSPVPRSLTVDAGRHSFIFECPGYATRTLMYDFTDSLSFLITVPMESMQEGFFNLRYQLMEGQGIYLNGQSVLWNAQDNTTTIKINGKNILGQVTAEDSSSTFFLIPDYMQLNESLLTTNVSPVDRASLIEKRRIWAYRGYSALVITLPITLISMGKFNSEYNAYLAGRNTNVDSVNFWYGARNISAICTGISAGFFIYELIRYFKAASSVLPETVNEIPYDAYTD